MPVTGSLAIESRTTQLRASIGQPQDPSRVEDTDPRKAHQHGMGWPTARCNQDRNAFHSHFRSKSITMGPGVTDFTATRGFCRPAAKDMSMWAQRRRFPARSCFTCHVRVLGVLLGGWSELRVGKSDLATGPSLGIGPGCTPHCRSRLLLTDCRRREEGAPGTPGPGARSLTDVSPARRAEREARCTTHNVDNPRKECLQARLEHRLEIIDNVSASEHRD